MKSNASFLKAFYFLSMVFCLLSTARAQIVTNGLVGYWPLDGNAKDVSGNGHNGTIIGAVPTTGVAGGAYYFNGSSKIDVGNLDFSNQKYTISGWMRTDYTPVPGANEYRTWIDKLDNNTGGPFMLGLGDAVTGGGGGNGPQYHVWQGGSGLATILKESLNLRDGKWHMFTVTYEKKFQKLYIDGALIDPDPDSSVGYDGDLPVNSVGVTIGGNVFASPYHNPWIGDIDEVAIYNRPLTSEEVLKLYKGTGIHLEVTPNSGTFTASQTFDAGIIVRGATSPIIGVRVVADGKDVSSLVVPYMVSGKVVNGRFSLSRNVGLGVGMHHVEATVGLQDGTVLTHSVDWEVLEELP